MLAIYCRISVDRVNQKSIKEQELLGQEFAIKHNFKFQTYVDKGLSGGGSIKDRPEFERLIYDIDSGNITALWVWNTDRTQREEIVWFTLADLLIKKNIHFYEDGKLVDLKDPNIFFLYGIKSQMDAMYKRVTSKKIKKVLSRNASEGKAHSSILPYGYGKDENGYLVIDEEEAKIVKRIYELSLSGVGTRSIAEKLSADGIKTRYNKLGKGTLTVKNKYTGVKSEINKTDIKWAGNTIRNIIINPIYKGVRHFGEKTYNAPAILDEIYWTRVNNNLKNNRNNSGKKVEHKYLLKGLLICGRCGRNYYGRTRTNKKDNYYMCSSKRFKDKNCGNRSLNIDVLESFIWLKLIVTNKLHSLIKNHLEKNSNNNKIRQLKSELEVFDLQSRKLLDDRKNAVKLAIKGLLSEDDIQPEMERIDKEILDLNLRSNNIKEQLESYYQLEEKASELNINLENLKHNVSFNDKGAIIKKYIKSITISYNSDWYVLELAFNIAGMSNEIFEIDKLYKIAVQQSNSVGSKVIQLQKKEIWEMT